MFFVTFWINDLLFLRELYNFLSNSLTWGSYNC